MVVNIYFIIRNNKGVKYFIGSEIEWYVCLNPLKGLIG